MSVISVPLDNGTWRLHYNVIPRALLYRDGSTTLRITTGNRNYCSWRRNMWHWEIRSLLRMPEKLSHAHNGRQPEIQKLPTGESHWSNTSFACFPHIFSPLWPKKVSDAASYLQSNGEIRNLPALVLTCIPEVLYHHVLQPFLLSSLWLLPQEERTKKKSLKGN